MNYLFAQIIEATDARTVNRIVENNISKINDNEKYHLTMIANRAKKRIHLVEVEKKLSWSDKLN
jgi:hypothetical protein